MTTLEDLKRAVNAVPPQPDINMDDRREYINLAYIYYAKKSDAALMAFEWHVELIERHAALSDKVGAHVTDWIAIDREEEEGMRLVERLK